MLKNKNYYRDYYENSEDMIIIADWESGQFLDCNEIVPKKTGYTKKEILNFSHFTELYHPDCHSYLAEAHNSGGNMGELKNWRLLLKTKDGKKIPVAVSTKILTVAKGKPEILRIIVRDITVLLAEEAEVISKNFELSKKNHDLTTLLYTLAHDIKTPLRLASYSLEEMEVELRQKCLCGRGVHLLNTTHQKILSMHAFINDTISYFALISGNHHMEVIDLCDLINKVKQRLSVPEGFQIITDFKPMQVTAKRFPLQEIVYNIVVNAIVHHPSPGKGRLKIKSRESRDEYIISLKDNGTGVPKKVISHFFSKSDIFHERFEHGLGLSLISRLTDSLNGRVSVRSGKGTVFTLAWPKGSNSAKPGS